MYVQVWNHWACWCQCHSYPPAEAPLSLVLDYLHASDFRSSQTKEGFQTFKKNQNDDPYQKALRWVALKLDLPVLTALQRVKQLQIS